MKRNISHYNEQSIIEEFVSYFLEKSRQIGTLLLFTHNDSWSTSHAVYKHIGLLYHVEPEPPSALCRNWWLAVGASKERNAHTYLLL